MLWGCESRLLSQRHTPSISCLPAWPHPAPPGMHLASAGTRRSVSARGSPAVSSSVRVATSSSDLLYSDSLLITSSCRASLRRTGSLAPGGCTHPAQAASTCTAAACSAPSRLPPAGGASAWWQGSRVGGWEVGRQGGGRKATGA